MTRAENPTRTLTIERAWLRDINRRWAKFTKSVVTQLRQSNKAAQIVNVEEPFAMDPSQIRTYMQFLEGQINDILLDAQLGGEVNWQARYQLQSYERSINVSRAALRAQGASIAATQAERIAALGITTFDIAPSLATASIQGFPPIHADALEFIFTRSFDSLKGWTDKMAVETRQILFDGANEGKGISTIVREMRKRIDVSKSRAQLIARTETIQAFQIAGTKEAERAAEELDEEVLLRWLTSRDGRVRHLHARWHGQLFTPQQNAKNINISPWNCRCSQAPVIAEANTEANDEKFAKQRTALLKLETAQSRRRA